MRSKSKMGLIMVAMLACLAMPLAAHAVLFGFDNITKTTTVSGGYFSVDVTKVDDTHVSFEFLNNYNANTGSFIEGVYFDDGSLLGISSIQNGTGVSFTKLATPAELPGWNNATPNFDTSAGFSADVTKNAADGVNPGESVKIIFELKSNQTFDDTLAALARAIDVPGQPNGLRIGIHVQGINSSDSYVNTNPVPEPSTLLLLGSGFLGLVGYGLRRKSKK